MPNPRKTVVQPLGVIAGVVALAVLIAVAGSTVSVTVAGVPLFALCAVIAFLINWLVYVPSWLHQTEHWFDLTGSLTYATLVIVALLLNPLTDPRGGLLAALVLIWAARLGSFLFMRVRRDGSDGRFDRLKPFPLIFLQVWTIQGLWVLLTLGCALAALTSQRTEPLGVTALVGAAIWLAGFAIEVVADLQKSRFRADPANAGRFISTGLWAWSRHPNYFGEIVLWLGIAIIALPVLESWALVTLISPIFVYILLTRVSGIPLLAERGCRRWGEDPAYQDYLRRTSQLVPWPPGRRVDSAT